MRAWEIKVWKTANVGIDYVTVVMAVIFIYAVIYWFVLGKKTFTGVKRVEHENTAFTTPITTPTTAVDDG